MAWNDPGRNRNPWGNRPDRAPPTSTRPCATCSASLPSMFGGGGGRQRPDDGRGGGNGGGSAAMRGFGFSTDRARAAADLGRDGVYTGRRRRARRRDPLRQVTSRPPSPGLRWHIPWPIEARQIVNVEIDRELQRPDPHADLRREPRRPQRRRAVPARRPGRVRSSTCATRRRRSARSARARSARSSGAASSTSCSSRGARKSPRAPRNSCSAHSTSTRRVSKSPPSTCSRRQRARAGADLAARRDQGARGPERLGLEAQAYANDILPKARVRPRARPRTRRRTRRASSPTPRARPSVSRSCSPRTSARPDVTRKRLYYETIEEVLGNTNKVLVDTKGTAATCSTCRSTSSTERRAPTLTLDEQRQSAAGRARRDDRRTRRRSTVDARRERGTR